MAEQNSSKPRRTLGIIIHGLSNTREYKAWHAAYRRCYTIKDRGYPNYGGRGIEMCEEWRNSVQQFVCDMGPCPTGYTLERIDVNGNYTKDNCTWIPRSKQSSNRTNTIKINHNGETRSLKEWARFLGIPYMTVLNRHRRGAELFARGRLGSPWNKVRK